MLRSLLLCILLVLSLSTVEAEDVRAGRVVGLATTMTAWVAAHTDYAAPEPPPVEFQDQETLRQRCYPGFASHQVPLIRGIYDPENPIIYLDSDCDLDNLVDASYLLHEVVHHVQLANNAHLQVQCRDQLEGEAVTLQALWLKEKGISEPLEALGIDERTLRIIGSCQR
ncbi:DUF6647 domain-containing protein [Vreelandella rituensis]|uniref:DUF6647 domain-containing protein n=1 Tax=Vreelandella rituensis TaxID=2282306 RepID=A0A368U5T9_9GAMM|nr:DUF6647 family protein [Halomonas rituensis]RCV92509.1 hypothetical protein DU506_07320 [Halomonas rituensis]